MYKTAVTIVERLQKEGYKAYFAGGSVRDMLLGLEPKDYDIVTTATPDEIEGLLPKTIPVGKKFGVMLAVENGHHFEIATFRSDAGYSDGRRPDYVTFTDPKEDAMRRDFTINGMFYDPIADEVLDYVEGKKYLRSRVIHFIGNPEERIKEDHLRILRAVRFAHQIAGQYHPETYAAVKKYAHLITDVSKERIRDELNKILLSPTRANALEDLQDLGILQHVLPEVELMKGIAQPLMYHKEGSVWSHALKAIRSLGKKPSLNLVWATLLHDVGKPQTFSIEERIRYDGHAEKSAEIARSILERLAFQKKDREKIIWMIEHHMMLFNVFEMSEAKQRKWVLDPWWRSLMALHKADASGTVPKELDGYKKLQPLTKHIKATQQKSYPVLLNGFDLMQEFGVPKGPRVGELLEELHEAQVMGTVKTKEEARLYVYKKLK